MDMKVPSQLSVSQFQKAVDWYVKMTSPMFSCQFSGKRMWVQQDTRIVNMPIGNPQCPTYRALVRGGSLHENLHIEFTTHSDREVEMFRGLKVKGTRMALEDVRIEYLGMQRYPGARSALEGTVSVLKAMGRLTITLDDLNQLSNARILRGFCLFWGRAMVLGQPLVEEANLMLMALSAVVVPEAIEQIVQLVEQVRSDPTTEAVALRSSFLETYFFQNLKPQEPDQSEASHDKTDDEADGEPDQTRNSDSPPDDADSTDDAEGDAPADSLPSDDADASGDEDSSADPTDADSTDDAEGDVPVDSLPSDDADASDEKETSADPAEDSLDPEADPIDSTDSDEDDASDLGDLIAQEFDQMADDDGKGQGDSEQAFNWSDLGDLPSIRTWEQMLAKNGGTLPYVSSLNDEVYKESVLENVASMYKIAIETDVTDVEQLVQGVTSRGHTTSRQGSRFSARHYAVGSKQYYLSRAERVEVDAAVSIGLDGSGSMFTCRTTQAAAAYLSLSQALDVPGVDLEGWIFADDITLFQEIGSALDTKRLEGYLHSWTGGTVLAGSIASQAMRLSASQRSTKWLAVITDAELDFHGDDDETLAKNAKTHRSVDQAIELAQSLGVKVTIIALVKSTYQNPALVLVEDVKTLSTVLKQMAEDNIM